MRLAFSMSLALAGALFAAGCDSAPTARASAVTADSNTADPGRCDGVQLALVLEPQSCFCSVSSDCDSCCGGKATGICRSSHSCLCR